MFFVALVLFSRDPQAPVALLDSPCHGTLVGALVAAGSYLLAKNRRYSVWGQVLLGCIAAALLTYLGWVATEAAR